MRQKAQSLVEYAVLICIIVAALISMQVYIKRGVQGSLRSNADSIGSVAYSPKATLSNAQTNVISKTLKETSRNDTEGDIFWGFNQRSTTIDDITQTSNQTEDVLPLDQEPRRF